MTDRFVKPITYSLLSFFEKKDTTFPYLVTGYNGGFFKIFRYKKTGRLESNIKEMSSNFYDFNKGGFVV